MENKITLLGLVTELAEKNYSEGYNDGYQDAVNSYAGILETMKQTREWVFSENDLNPNKRNSIITRLDKEIAKAEGK